MVRWTCLLLLISPALAIAADIPSIPSALTPDNVIGPGHSMLGEVFDEGPRHAATLTGTTGRVTFPITTNVQLAQQFFNQGIGQLHGYWYFEAERSFRQVAMLDPECAMSFYGMALANINNESRAKGFIAEAVKRKERSSEREKRYIDALSAWYKADAGDEKKRKSRARDYVNAIEEILYRFPDDLEAKALLGLTLWQKRSELDENGLFAIDALLNDVLAVNPFHPVHHYRIHLWDNDKAKIAVNSAERCGMSAPGIAHMWHMSGHTYSELNQYFDAAWHQEASARTDHAYMMRNSVFPDRIHNFAHNNEWLVKTMSYLGRIHDAVALARNTIELPQHPKHNPFPGGKSAHFGRLRLFQLYSQFELWDQLIADAQTQILGPTADEAEQVKYFRHLGRAYFRKGDMANGQTQLSILENRLHRLQQQAEIAVDEAVTKARIEGSDAKTIETKRTQARQPTAERIRLLERAIDELQGYVLLAAGKPTDALARLIRANEVDDAFLADVELIAGKPDDSLKRLRDWVGRSKNQVRPNAALVLMLWQQGKKEDARLSFEVLREVSGSIDLDVPIFARLRSVADELGFKNDWRKPKPIARNAAELPELSTLGPIFWQPMPAPGWSLPDENRQMHSLAECGARPVVLIFYLGYGCLHCAEQLQAFAPKQAQYAAAGISLIAISTDSVENLKKAHERYKSDQGFPFQLVSDASLDVFKQYNAFDDFESSPLHATILLDGAGKIRWHDIGAEPFMNVEFLLQEAKRLLYPEQLELPHEPRVLEQSIPADALSPRNV